MMIDTTKNYRAIVIPVEIEVLRDLCDVRNTHQTADRAVSASAFDNLR